MLRICHYKKIQFPKIRTLSQFTASDNGNDDAFETDFFQNHVQINNFQRGLLALGSAFVSLVDPYRHDMIACLGETAGI